MARSPVGYRSPFNKISSIKPSPMKAVDPATAQIIAAAAPGIISGISSLFGRKKRRREQAAARKEMEAAKQAYMDMKFENPYAGLQDPLAGLQDPLAGVTNPYAGMENPYSENLYEDLTVDTQGADYLRQQQQHQQANIMQGLKGAAGSSGVAGLAQSMANIGTQQAQKAAAIVSQQEQQNRRLRLQGEQAKREGTFEFDKMQRKAGFDVDLAKRKSAYTTDTKRRLSAYEIDVIKREGQQKYVTAMEQQRTASLYGLGLDRLSAADKARSTARSGFIRGLGQGISGAAGTFMPGGINYNTLGGSGGTPSPYQGYYPSTGSYAGDMNRDGIPDFLERR